jgi:large subunit ribosomal protein L9e
MMVNSKSNFLVEVTIKSRVVSVKGKRGVVTKAFKHLKVELIQGTSTNDKNEKTQYVEVNTYMSTYKQAAVMYTIASHIKNMIKGVTKGFRYKMHIVKKHFPIEIKIDEDHVEIGRFLGERDLKIVKLMDGVKASKNEKNQEELYFDGNDIEKVALTCK